jgi:beta-1,2-mannobiose phosphorylase / 1,2-beta-oligomannan phosphorylase
MVGIEVISYFIVFLGLAIVLIAAALVFLYKISPETRKIFSLLRHAVNPVISPTMGSEWDEVGTFNPAAVEDDQGNVHLVYRAVGNDGVSRFGYAKSYDGRDFSEKSPYPIFAMQNPRSAPKKYEPMMFASGGSWGGCEDPRTVRIDGKVYVTFNAFDGWDFIRMAVVSIDEKDFFNNKWKWSRPMLISPPKQINKNWVLFPEKVNGKFAILHSISPRVQIDYVDRLEDLERGSKVIKSHFGQKAPRSSWDTYLRGAGAPPILTEKGWLLLYHATEKHEPHKYKLGAMLLDKENPEVIVATSPGPILFSNNWYENDWKPGVVYASGAVVRDDNLMVYYGGGDKHICIAHTPLNELLNWMVPV